LKILADLYQELGQIGEAIIVLECIAASSGERRVHPLAVGIPPTMIDDYEGKAVSIPG
jgi:hypothetical protein